MSQIGRKQERHQGCPIFGLFFLLNSKQTETTTQHLSTTGEETGAILD